MASKAQLEAAVLKAYQKRVVGKKITFRRSVNGMSIINNNAMMMSFSREPVSTQELKGRIRVMDNIIKSVYREVGDNKRAKSIVDEVTAKYNTLRQAVRSGNWSRIKKASHVLGQKAATAGKLLRRF